MDERRFDLLTRQLAHGLSRRSVLKGLLGFSGAASVASILDPESEARRSSSSDSTSTTPAPYPCPTGTSPCETNSTGCCADCGGDRPITCGYDCCAGLEQCCDGECCPDNHTCIGEETCCRNDLICAVSGGCCQDGEKCCVRDSVSYCIPVSGCCDSSECSVTDTNCQDPVCEIGAWNCQAIKKVDGTECFDGNFCTGIETCQDGICQPGNPVNCDEPLNDCYTVTCEPTTGICSDDQFRGAGSPCNNGQGNCSVSGSCIVPCATDDDCGSSDYRCLANGTCGRRCSIESDCAPLNCFGCAPDGTSGRVCIYNEFQGRCDDLGTIECPLGSVCVNGACETTCGVQN